MKRRLFLFIALALAAIVYTAPAASAGSNFGRVDDLRGWSAFVDCGLSNWDKRDPEVDPRADHTIYQYSTGRKYSSRQFDGCSDADAFYLRGEHRCVAVTDIGGTRYIYKAEPGRWFKLPGYHRASLMLWNECPSYSAWLSSKLRILKP